MVMTKRNKKRSLSDEQKQQRVVIGVTWYTPEQFARMKAVADDADALDDTHADWLENAKRQVEWMKKDGFEVVEIPIDVAEWVAWCRENGHVLNGEARSEFVSQKVAGRI
jgi:hypothetical protein